MVPMIAAGVNTTQAKDLAAALTPLYAMELRTLTRLAVELAVVIIHVTVLTVQQLLAPGLAVGEIAVIS